MVERYWRDLKQTLSSWLSHEGARLAAALSFYSLLSLAPLVILSIAMASLAFGRSAAQDAMITEVHDLMGAAGARAVQTVIEYGKEPRAGGVASAIGVVILLLGASSVFGELQSALNKIWDAKPPDDTEPAAAPVDPRRVDGLIIAAISHVSRCLQPICATDPAGAAYPHAIIEPEREPWLIVEPVGGSPGDGAWKSFC